MDSKKLEQIRDAQLAEHYYKKYKETGKLSYALLRQALIGDGDLTVGKHHA